MNRPTVVLARWMAAWCIMAAAPLPAAVYSLERRGGDLEAFADGRRFAVLSPAESPRWTLTHDAGGTKFITFVFAPQLIDIFRDDAAVVDFGTLSLRLSSITMPFTGVAMATNFLLQTSGRTLPATILGACRLGLVLGPVVLVLPPLLGMLGVQIAQPVTDIITTLIALPMARSVLKELSEAEAALSANQAE